MRGKRILAQENIIILAHAISQGIFTIIMISLYRRASEQIPGLGYWTLNIGVQCITPILLLAKIPVSPALTYGTFSLLTFLGAMFFYFGLAEFTQTTIRKRYYYALIILLSLSILLSFFLSLQSNVRYILVSVGCIIFAGSYLNLLIRNYHKHQAYKSSFFPLILLYFAFGLFHLLRIINLFLNTDALTQELIQDTPYFIGTQLFTFSLLLGVNLVILLLISQKLVQDLSIEAQQKNLLLEKLKIFAERDGLTGLFNRSTMEAYLSHLFTLPTEGRKDLMLFFIDVDSFKKTNDTYGHETGDLVLCQLAKIFQRLSQNNDRVGRWGGDEFLIILHRPEETSAKALADEFVEAVHSYDWNKAGIPEPLQVSISCGYKRIGSVPSKRELLREVDQYLYTAKRNGRNVAEGN